MKLEIKNLSMSYPGVTVFDKLNFTIDLGKVTCLVGPSGCGKTTLLSLLSGSLSPQSGTVEPDIKGKVAFMFQESRLLPWLTVLGNVTYLMEETLSTADKKIQGMELIRKVGLSGFEYHYPPELSGGMVRRVALARALGKNAPLLLMDEPFSSMDDDLINRMIILLREILQKDPRTVLYVTHDMRVARELADKIVYMKRLEKGLTIIKSDNSEYGYT